MAACLALMTLPCSCTDDRDHDTLRLMFYNVENFFDTRHDSLRADRDFLPGGTRHWTRSRYDRKLISLYKTIAASGKADPPDLVALCEVENRKVLQNLISDTYLSKFGYRIIHEESPDQRGIDVCMIYRTDRLKLLAYKYWIPEDEGKRAYPTRSILFVRFGAGRDTLNLIMNHWPSRRGGTLAASGLRNIVSRLVKEKADSIGIDSHWKAKVIIAGDFNSTPNDEEILLITGSRGDSSWMKNLSAPSAERGRGTYRYMGTWEMLDQVIVSASLINAKGGLFTDESLLTIFRPKFLLKKDPKYPGYMPFATYRGYKYQGGYSDHLPVLLDIGIR
jgi:hypothetical protein